MLPSVLKLYPSRRPQVTRSSEAAGLLGDQKRATSELATPTDLSVDSAGLADSGVCLSPSGPRPPLDESPEISFLETSVSLLALRHTDGPPPDAHALCPCHTSSKPLCRVG